MPKPSASAVALAMMRAAGTLPRPAAGATLASWQQAAARAGRVVREVALPSVGQRVTLGWVEASEPLAGPDTGVTRAMPSPVLVLTFAAALAACWIDRFEHPFPGRSTSEDAVLVAVAALGPLTRGAVEGGEGAERHRKGALRRLHDARLLVLDGSTIRLGPAVALWSDAQVGPLRVIYDQLPTAPGDAA